MCVCECVFNCDCNFIWLGHLKSLHKISRDKGSEQLTIDYNNGCRIYMDILAGKNCRQFRLLTWNSCIGQLVHQLKGEVIGVSLF